MREIQHHAARAKLARWTTVGVTAMGLALQLMMPRAADADHTGDLERLQWLAGDYQLPVKGYVIEAWFALPERFGLDRVLAQELQIADGERQGTLPDGSLLSSGCAARGGKRYVELQLVTGCCETAQRYYARWQGFADRYRLRPVGATVVVDLPDAFDARAAEQLTAELAGSLRADSCAVTATETLYQCAGYSPQLCHGLSVGGETVNFDIAFAAREGGTALYLATPVIYQQY